MKTLVCFIMKPFWKWHGKLCVCDWFLCVCCFLDVILVTICKCVACSKATWCGFPHMSSKGPRTNQHKNMSCFGGGSTLISIGQKSCTTKHEPPNKNLKTYHPQKHVKFWQAGKNLQNYDLFFGWMSFKWMEFMKHRDTKNIALETKNKP